ncbi:LuxR C-terminal-related transcriptional regulator [Gordonia sp. CPCC 205515]|uniref:helix-turn-helix transcriptional regulator n=1 Tax=Gordonia sp. CPCC 205515 TaxID=3140791 RepID=UPI003AF33524
MTISPSDMSYPSAASAAATRHQAYVRPQHAGPTSLEARRQAALAHLAGRRMPLPPHDRTAPRFTVVRPDDPAPYVPAPGPMSPDPSAAPTAPLPRPDLTRREIEVLRAWLLLDSKELVTQELHIAMGTVNTHLTRIRAKYAAVGRRARTKASLAARAIQDELLSLDEL